MLLLFTSVFFTTVTKYQSDQPDRSPADYIIHPINRPIACFWSEKPHGFDRRSKTAVPCHTILSQRPQPPVIGRSTWCERLFGASTTVGSGGPVPQRHCGTVRCRSCSEICAQLPGKGRWPRFYDALTLRIRQRRSEAAAVLQTLHNNLLPQNEEEGEIFSQASRKEVDRCITRMLLRMSGEGSVML